MSKHFNTSGPMRANLHYCIDPTTRVDWEEINDLIEAEKFFVLHAPRQTGKTSTLLAMADKLNQSGKYAALYINVESAQTARNDVMRGMQNILQKLAEGAKFRLNDLRLMDWQKEILRDNPPDSALYALLHRWAAESDKPTILMIDEADALIGDTLISLLRQLRDGYIGRASLPFPQSVILCGLRDVRDYRIHTSHHEIITGGSAFNIKAKSLRMGNFTPDEVQQLYAQHTADTGQVFEPEIFAPLWEDTHGQPWLVNALGQELIWENKEARDRTRPITLAQYRAARERLIQSRATHLDQLTDKLKEPRVHGVISALLAGETTDETLREDDVQYVEDLGLIETRPQMRIANRIYAEVIPRELTWTKQITIAHQQAWYLTPERRVDMPKLLAAFQQFFREHANSWIERFDYKEAGPQLLLQAFLQRIINGGGRINREYGLGRKRTDLYLEWPVDEAQGYYGEVQRVVIELKILYKSLDSTLAEGILQTAGYADLCNAAEAHLIIFDRRTNIDWDEKIWQREEQVKERKIGVWGM
ncbi:MAG: ATP-binding protein [Gallionella sp.]